MSKEVEKKTTKTPKAVDHKFLVEDLMDNCEELTGHKREVSAGALFDYKEERITKDDFIKKVNSFLKKEVK